MNDNIDNEAGSVERPLPTTLEGLKKLAKKIKRESGYIHTECLEIAARRMGYGSYKHARRELQDDGQP